MGFPLSDLCCEIIGMAFQGIVDHEEEARRPRSALDRRRLEK